MPILRPVLTLRILAFRVTDILSTPRSRRRTTPFSFPRHRPMISADRSLLRLLGQKFPSVLSRKFFITLSLFPFSFHRFQSRIPCPFGDQSRLRERLTLVSPPLPRSFDPSAFYYQPYYPRDNPAAFTRSAMFPQFSLFFFQATQYFTACLRRDIIIMPTFYLHYVVCQVGKHVYLIACIDSLISDSRARDVIHLDFTLYMRRKLTITVLYLTITILYCFFLRK